MFLHLWPKQSLGLKDKMIDAFFTQLCEHICEESLLQKCRLFFPSTFFPHLKHQSTTSASDTELQVIWVAPCDKYSMITHLYMLLNKESCKSKCLDDKLCLSATQTCEINESSACSSDRTQNHFTISQLNKTRQLPAWHNAADCLNVHYECCNHQIKTKPLKW